jgi:hypothetical protein
MARWIPVAILVLAGACAVTVALALRGSRAGSPPADLAGHVEKAAADLRAEALRKHPEMSESMALRAAAVERAESQMAQPQSTDSAAGNAAGNFIGFYLVNTRSRVQYCQARGVDLSPFVARFSAVHAPEWAKAQTLLRRRGMDFEQVWPQLKPTMDKLIEQGMRDTAASAQTDETGVCRYMADNPELVVPTLTYSTVSPTMERALMSAE